MKQFILRWLFGAELKQYYEILEMNKQLVAVNAEYLKQLQIAIKHIESSDYALQESMRILQLVLQNKHNSKKEE